MLIVEFMFFSGLIALGLGVGHIVQDLIEDCTAEVAQSEIFEADGLEEVVITDTAVKYVGVIQGTFTWASTWEEVAPELIATCTAEVVWEEDEIVTAEVVWVKEDEEVLATAEVVWEEDEVLQPCWIHFITMQMIFDRDEAEKARRAREEARYGGRSFVSQSTVEFSV